MEDNVLINHLHEQRRYRFIKFFGIIITFALSLCIHPTNTQAATENITLNQFHPSEELRFYSSNLGEYYYQVYPNDNQQDYKKFMKYTYKISDDSVIGLKLNGDIDFKSGILMTDKKGNTRAIYPYDVKVYALGPGSATLKVYNGKKLIDTFKFNVIADKAISPSSFANNTGDIEGKPKGTDKRLKDVYFTKGDIDKENTLLQKYAKVASNSKYTTTNQKVLAVLNTLIADNCKLMSEKEYDKWQAGIKADDYYTYRTAYSRLFGGKAIAGAFAEVNRAILSNLGFRCSTWFFDYDDAFNGVSLYMKNDIYEEQLKDRETFYKLFNEDYEEFDDVYGDIYEDNIYPEIREYELYDVEFAATNKLTSKYDFTKEEDDNIYKRTHLPAWIIGKDTAQQVINVGQTKKLSSSDMNSNIFSSDSSIVKVEDGEITGVNPGVAIVYRYNDTYCDVFYVLVKKKGAPKTIQAKVYTKSAKSYFKTTDIAPHIKGGQFIECQIEDWENLRIYELEPIFGHGGILKTKYSNGNMECYLEYNGNDDLLCIIGSGSLAR